MSAQLAQARVDDGDATAWAGRELTVMEAVERVKAWADAQGLAALARLREAIHDRCQAVADGYARAPTASIPLTVAAFADGSAERSDGRSESVLARAGEIALDVRAETESATVDEVMLATGLPESEVRRRVALAVDDDGHGSVVRAALAAGEVSLYRATAIHQQTRRLDSNVARAISARLLTPAPDGSVRSHRWFSQALRRQVIRHTPNRPDARAEAIATRRAYAFLNEDDGSGDGAATATLTVTGETSRVTAAMDRVTRLATRLRGDGDCRTLEQLRSDISIDLILDGWARPATSGIATGSGESRTAGVAGIHGHQELALFDRLYANAGSASAADLGPTTFVGAPPPAHVTVVVSLASLLGVDDAPADIPGWGAITASQARQAATAYGSVWRRLVTDPVTGAASDLSTRRYRPTRAMADLVAALDGTCRAPGCTVTATACYIDHNRPWPHGPTAIENLSAKHRRHHNHKTRGTWTCVADVHGTMTWTTAAGRRHVTMRFSYDDPLDQHVTEAEIEKARRDNEDDLPPF
ncbi:HNH endonuclease signature motif containing protein [Lapillicoccus sp.]|uniref:HNH endonuclease signature motif containing protein n=1 Tax=Lapillicoccus sp. TaxID=1909287 RepID=UPI003266E344